MELTDLTQEQKDKLYLKIIDVVKSGGADNKVMELILAEHPKLVYIKEQDYKDFLITESEYLKQRLEKTRAKTEQLEAEYSALKAHYEKSISKIAQRLRMDQQEAHSFMDWLYSHNPNPLVIGLRPILEIISIYWRICKRKKYIVKVEK